MRLRLVPSTHVLTPRPRYWPERVIRGLWRRIRGRQPESCGICAQESQVNHVLRVLCGTDTHRPVVVLMEANSCRKHEDLVKTQLYQYARMLVVTYTDMQPIGAFQ